MLRQFEVLVTRLTDALIASWDFLMASSCDFLSNESATRRSLQKGEHRTALYVLTVELASTSFMTLRAHIGHILRLVQVLVHGCSQICCHCLGLCIFRDSDFSRVSWWPFSSLWIQFLTYSVVFTSKNNGAIVQTPLSF